MDTERQLERPDLPPFERVVDHVKSLPQGSKFTAQAIAIQCQTSTSIVRRALHAVFNLYSERGVYTLRRK